MKKILLYCFCFLISLTFCSCGDKKCDHVFSEATCQSPEICSLCGEKGKNTGSHKYENHVCTICGNLTRTAKEVNQYVVKKEKSFSSLVSLVAKPFKYSCQTTVVTKGTKVMLNIAISNYENPSPSIDATFKEFSTRVLVKIDDITQLIKKTVPEFNTITCNFYSKNQALIYTAETGKITTAEKYIIKHPKTLNQLKKALTSETDVRLNVDITASENRILVNVTLLNIATANETTYDTINTMKQTLQPPLNTLLLALQKDLPDTEIICSFYSQGGQLI